LIYLYYGSNKIQLRFLRTMRKVFVNKLLPSGWEYRLLFGI